MSKAIENNEDVGELTTAIFDASPLFLRVPHARVIATAIWLAGWRRIKEPAKGANDGKDVSLARGQVVGRE